MIMSCTNHVTFARFGLLAVSEEAKHHFTSSCHELGKGYQPQPSDSTDTPYLDLDYSGYDKKNSSNNCLNVCFCLKLQANIQKHDAQTDSKIENSKDKGKPLENENDRPRQTNMP